MAEQIPYCVAASLINKLASFAFRELGSIYGVSDDLEKLKSTLESIKVVLSDAEQRQAEDPVIHHWVCRFKQVLHDADDLMDDLLLNDLRRKVDDRSKVRVLFPSGNQFVFRAKIAHKIKRIRKNFNDVADDMAKLKLNSSLVVLKQDDIVWRETSSFVLESEVIGRDDDKKKIIELLMQTQTLEEQHENVSLVAIVGIGGLGKTTLAQFVYNDAEVKRIFHKFMWVCVSEDFEVKTILNKMLKSLKKEEVGDLELDILQQKLRDELNGQRYMLVLDDVWNENKFKWDALRTHLLCDGEGSVILVTTRSKGVAQTMGVSNPYVLEGLSKEQSWALLKKVTFGKDVTKMSPNLVSIGEEIAKKCGGVPLAIKTLGGLLQSRHEESEWMRILDGDIWRLCGEKESIMPVLKLSYRNLPFELRQCFAYCCLYPKDWEIKRGELIQLWMAQGYLDSSEETRFMEDVGNHYVKILLMMSFFQEPKFDEYGDITSFKMHDLMHDLATSVAGNDCYLDSEGKGNIERAMHISFLSCAGVHSLDPLNGSKARTYFGLKIKDKFLAIPSTMLNVKYLRALDLSSNSITKLPKFIGKCKHLRYLDLSYCRQLISLPKSIENLALLQTLKLTGCCKLVFCVEVITKLISLRYLYIDGCEAFKEKIPAGLGKLVSLRYLSDFVVGGNGNSKSAKLNEFQDLNLIEDLVIRKLNLVECVLSVSQETNLRGKKHIQSLTLMWGEHMFDWKEEECKNSDSLQLLENLCPYPSLRKLQVYGYPGLRYSSWLSSLTSIVDIDLRGFSNCQYLPPLEKLPSLEKLMIQDMKELKCIHYEEISQAFFPSLKTLFIVDCKNMWGWQRLGNDNDSNDMHNNLCLPPFPTLSELRIYECPNLTCMPTFPHLERLELNNCSTKPLIDTCLVELKDSSFCSLSALECLYIGKVTEAETIVKEWLQNLMSLKRLNLGNSCLLQHMQHIPSELQELSFSSSVSDRVDLWKNEGDVDTQCHEPPPAFRSLRTICISECKNMKTLPEQIGYLKSLRHIHIRNCIKLESLPEAIRCLTNLQTLEIRSCPLLQDRCQAETGQDWPKIAHIPNISIY